VKKYIIPIIICTVIGVIFFASDYVWTMELSPSVTINGIETHDVMVYKKKDEVLVFMASPEYPYIYRKDQNMIGITSGFLFKCRLFALAKQYPTVFIPLNSAKSDNKDPELEISGNRFRFRSYRGHLVEVCQK